jgi:hypothetical protein
VIRFELDRENGILTIRPDGPLQAADFQAISLEVDPYIAANGRLTGLMVEAPSFPGWESFGALVQHLRFVRDHHRQIDRVAAVTDSNFVRIVPRIADHFANPEIRVFGSDEKERALHWLETGA